MNQPQRLDASSIVLDLDNSGKQNKLPSVWVTDFLAGDKLRDYFPTIYSPEVPALEPKGPQILSFDPDTPEKIWRETAYPLLNAGCPVGVKKVGGVSKEPLQWWIENTSASDVAMDILYNHISFSDWEDSLADNPLSLREALELAELVIVKLGDEKEATIALDALRRRANVSSFDWNNTHLAEIRARLEKSLVLSSPEQLLDALIKEDLSGAALTNRLNHLAKEIGRSVTELRKQYTERVAEIEKEEEREDTQSQIETLLDASRASINLRETLPHSLAEPLVKLSGWLNLKPEVYLTALLTATSILHKTGTRVLLNKSTNFKVSPNLFSAIVALSSQKKSPILNAICTEPLKVLQKEAQIKYKEELQKYEEDLREWEVAPKEERGEPPIKPEREVYFFTKATGEGITYQAARCPERGMLYLSDELTGMLNGQNQYRGGKGSDKQDLLSYYDGSGDTVLRSEGLKSEVESVLLGILGSTQPKVIQKLLGSCDDPDGTWARFLFVNQPLAASELPSDSGKYDLTELLVDLYRKIDALPTTEYYLSRQADKLFREAYKRLEHIRVNERLEGMQSVWGKSEGRIGKLAVNLHVAHALMRGETPSQEIPVDIIRIAIKLTKFYAQQVQSLYTQFSDPDALAPQLAKVIELSQQKGGWIKASDIYLSITKKHRPSGEVVRSWFGELAVMGKGEIKGEGRSVKFRAFLPNDSPPLPPTKKNSDKLDEIRQELDKSSNAETTLYQVVQEKLDKLDKLDDFQKSRMDVEVVEEEVNLTSGDEKNLLLDDLSNLSNFAQNLDPERDTALDDLSKKPSNLDDLSDLDNQSPLEVIAPVSSPGNEPEQAKLPIYQRSDGDYEVELDKLDKSLDKPSNPVEVDEQVPQQAATNPETTPLEQLMIRLANVATKEGFEVTTAGESLKTIQDAIDLQDTAAHRQLLKGFFNEVHPS
jgi:Sec-independent protein translocase protein TatA